MNNRNLIIIDKLYKKKLKNKEKLTAQKMHIPNKSNEIKNLVVSMMQMQYKENIFDETLTLAITNTIDLYL
jgi:hypothetical protein